MIFAIDFDGTIFDHDYPEIGVPFYNRINKLIEIQRKGHKLILWTCRGFEGNRDVLKEAVEACKKLNLVFDAINEDLEETKERFPNRIKSCKVYADYYIDDRNLDLLDFFKL